MRDLIDLGLLSVSQRCWSNTLSTYITGLFVLNKAGSSALEKFCIHILYCPCKL